MSVHQGTGGGVRHLRIFFSSPGDVADERAAALAIVDRLRYDPFVRGRVTLEAVSWDGPGGAPILAARTPQASIDAGMPQPAACDIVVVLLWGRMGTPLPHAEYAKPDGSPYASGTEWEFENALAASRRHGRPAVLLYRCRRELLIDANASEAAGGLRQAEQVRAFFSRLRDPGTGAFTSGYRDYRTVDEFRTVLDSHLRVLLHQIIEASAPEPAPDDAAPLWPGSPFPGLRAFTPDDAPIFFGRGRETDELLTRVRENRFVAVVGASGSGKSSLVGAGLVPRLSADPELRRLVPAYDRNTGQWHGLHVTPGELGDNPFVPLAARLAPALARPARALIAELSTEPDRLSACLAAVLAADRTAAEALVVIDQFEELFTLAAPAYVGRFVAMLVATAESPRARVVITMRADFYHRCLAFPELTRLLERGQFPLSAPRDTLLDMIVGPADRAGLRLEEGLPGRLLADTGGDGGALPLLAYTLDELHRVGAGTRTLTHEAYEGLGGVRGAIGTRAEDVFNHRLDDEARAAFDRVFGQLVEIDEAGRATRRRAAAAVVAPDAAARQLVDVFTDARLIVQGADPRHEPTVYVAHEALFAGWHRLRAWIETVRDDFRLLRKTTVAAQEWNDNGRSDAFRWPHERLAPVYDVIKRRRPVLEPVVESFIEPEYVRSLALLADPGTEPTRRYGLIDRLVAIGDVTVPGLAALLGSGDEQVREAAAMALVRLTEASVPALIEVVTSASADARLGALGALRQIGDQRGLSAYAYALRDPDVRVRSVAAGAIEALGGDLATGPLEEALSDQDLDVRWRAVGVLGAFGAEATRPLLISTADPDPKVRTRAMDALTRAAPIDQLVDALHDDMAQVRSAAADALAAAGSPAATALCVALRDDDPDVRWRAAGALGAIGDPATAPALVEALADGEAAVRRSAISALGRCGADGVAALTAVLAGADADPADAATHALAAIGAPAVPHLAGLIERPQPGTVRVRAAAALRGIGLPAVPALATLLSAADPTARILASHCLAALSADAVPVLAEALAEPGTADLAAATLREIGDPARLTVMSLATHSDGPVRAGAATALAGCASADGWRVLIDLLRDPDPAVRERAARSVSECGAEALSEVARAAAPGDPRRPAAIRALAAAGPAGTPHLIPLAAGDPDGSPSNTITIEPFTSRSR